MNAHTGEALSDLIRYRFLDIDGVHAVQRPQYSQVSFIISMRCMPACSLHRRKVVLCCLAIVTPMLASCSVVVWIVFANLVHENCPVEELCHELDAINTTSRNHFYIDFPAARLAFIASSSSTVSFALIGLLMTMHAYTNAASFLRASNGVQTGSLLTPRQLSTLLRVLNAEWMVLWDLSTSKLKAVFWDREDDTHPSHRLPQILRRGISVLMAGIFASVLIQAADVYFHIAAEAIEFIQVQELSPVAYPYSRGLAPWCLERPVVGDLGQKNYWGCAITARSAAYNNATSLAPTNASIIQDMKNSISSQHKVLSFTDSSGVQYAIIGPADSKPSMDWKASSFGVSTTCSAIPQGGCDVYRPVTEAKDGQGTPVVLVPFNCTSNKAGIDIAGNLTSHNTKTHTMNFHKYAAESAPFFNSAVLNLEESRTIRDNLNGGEDANDILRNSWNAFVMRKIPTAEQGDFSQLPHTFETDLRVWTHPLLGVFVLLHCNITVWDLTYASVESKITILSQSLSNGSTAGISSMPGTRFIGTLANIFQDESTGPVSRSSPDNFIRSFEMGMSKAYSYPLASQTIGQPSLLAQARLSKIVTKLPIAGFWFLIGANMGFAVLGLAVGIGAVRKTTETIGQVQMRLGLVGLVAALFDRRQFEKAAKCDEELFEEVSMEDKSSTKRVAVMETREGGASFALTRSR
ncbi:hypothetical protein BU25DRAFT_336057 [Macroventuria anomochaeta]|uniref:Uncharacterized protein n=1 Tax=Macroventuria anomochaeta TaxID=301207 RepID=A0ACB6S768_9PLEO|nr:uncharacterized protein BU25DRAFT_336057 [Macroventuria anomochaeta]KAF2629852.1 hypothetical protein BU25DRAFT_336057 [Macroventuria anomochaeta]